MFPEGASRHFSRRVVLVHSAGIPVEKSIPMSRLLVRYPIERIHSSQFLTSRFIVVLSFIPVYRVNDDQRRSASWTKSGRHFAVFLSLPFRR